MGSMSDEQFHKFLQCTQKSQATNQSGDSLHAHCCPVCEKVHLVNQARHSVAYGKQLTCCCECEAQKRKLQRLLNRMHNSF